MVIAQLLLWVVLLLLLVSMAPPATGRVRSWGPRGHVRHPQPGAHAGKSYAIAQNETTGFEHTLAPQSQGGMVTYFWMVGGPIDALGRYITDTLIVRYYIDGEAEASLVFTPAMMAGSGVGMEGLAYYQVNTSDPNRSNCTATGDAACGHPSICGATCGQDLLDGWPWETRWVGKGGAMSSWISHMRVPFSKSFRVTFQVACGTPECVDFGIPAEFARPDIDATVSTGNDFIVRGLEASSADELSVALGLGSLELPSRGSDWSKFRLRLLRQTSTPRPGDFVALVNYTGTEGEDGAVLMMTVVFEGINVPNGLSVEGCWWALDSPEASLHAGDNSSDRRGAQLLGTGVEDLFGDGFGFTYYTRLFHSDDWGLTHIRGGPNAEPVRNLGNARGMFSAYRVFDKDPLTFEGGRLALLWRNGGPKCGMPEVGEEVSTPAEFTGSEVASLSSYVWFYTWE